MRAERNARGIAVRAALRPQRRRDARIMMCPRKPAEPHKPVIERAFELARTGQYRTLTDLEKTLHGEGYPKGGGQMMAPSLRKQLRALCRGSARA